MLSVAVIFFTTTSGSCTALAADHSLAKIQNAAAYWFTAFQNGKIDRSKFTEDAAKQLTPETLAKIEKLLREVGPATSFEFLRSRPIGPFRGYSFLVTSETGVHIVESIAFSANGKVAGVDFQTLPIPSK